MSHLLATANPDAVRDDIPETLPKIGDIVTYLSRPGEGRRGRHEFPAMVLAQNNLRGRTGLDLIVVYDANDVIFRDSVQQLDEHYDNSCWKEREGGEADLRKQLQETREEIASLRALVLGDWNDPAKPLIEYLVDFEARLNKETKAAGSSPKAPSAEKAKKRA